MSYLNSQKSVSAETMPVPFAGMGVDLEKVRQVALSARAVFVDSSSETEQRFDLPDFIPASAGYVLLTELGREIRGR